MRRINGGIKEIEIFLAGGNWLLTMINGGLK